MKVNWIIRQALPVLTLVSALFIGPTCAAQDAIVGAFARYAQTHPDLAVALNVSRAGEPSQTLVAGPIRPGADQMATPAGPWHVGSVAKSFTATLAMRLAERDILDLDTPIDSYLAAEGMHPDWRALTLRALLSHSSGLQSNPAPLAWSRGRDSNPAIAREDELARLWGDPIEGERGTFSYSNLGYMLAAQVIEDAAGQSWRDLVDQEIVRPLALDSLDYGPPSGPEAIWGRRNVAGLSYAVDPSSRFADNPVWMDAAGRFHMSLDDLTVWGRAYLDACAGTPDAIITRDSCLEMRQPVAANASLGWLIGRPGPEGGTVVWHNGSNTLWYAMLMLLPEQDIVIALVQNRFDYEAADAMLAEVLDAVMDES